MQAVVIAVAATLVVKSSAFGQSRALWNLGSMGSCNLGYYPLVYYNGYGCWCGMGGSGTPVDEIDELVFLKFAQIFKILAVLKAMYSILASETEV